MKRTPKVIVGALELAYRMGYIDRDDEIVRCKDCFFRNEKGYCNLIVGIEMEMDDDDYCSWAERKEE